MKYFEYETEQKKNEEEISLDNLKDKKFIEQEDYQKYLRKEYSEDLQKKKIDVIHLENIFTNEIYYQSMKKLSLLEKRILYLSLIKSYKLEDICKKLKLSKKEVIITKENSIKHFINNVQKIKNSTFKGGAKNE